MSSLCEWEGNIRWCTQNVQRSHNYRLNRTTKQQLVDNLNLRNHVVNTHPNENWELHNEWLWVNASSLRQREAHQRVRVANRAREQQCVQEHYASLCTPLNYLPFKYDPEKRLFVTCTNCNRKSSSMPNAKIINSPLGYLARNLKKNYYC